MNNQLPFISIIIPVRNEEKFIRNTLQMVKNQDYPADLLEILVVDGESTDRTKEVVLDFKGSDENILLLDNPKRLSSAARNIGAKNARGEIIVFIDGHIYIDNDQILRHIVRLMREKNVSVLSRPQFLETPDNTDLQNAIAFARKSILGHGLDSTIYTNDEKYVDPTSSGAVYAREIFSKVGYFDESFDAAEDVEFNYRVHRAGYTSFTSPLITVYYYPRNSLSQLFRQMVRYGRGRFRFLRKHRTGFKSGAILLAMMFLLGFILLALSPFFIFTFYLFVLGLTGYLGLIVLTSFILSIKSKLKLFTIFLFIFPVIHVGLSLGFWAELLRSSKG